MKKDEIGLPIETLKIGTEVRIKKAKGKMDKASTPNWWEQTYFIEKVRHSDNPTIKTSYLIKGDKKEGRYTRNDLLPVENVGEIPNKPTRRITRQTTRKALTEGALTRAQKLKAQGNKWKIRDVTMV